MAVDRAVAHYVAGKPGGIRGAAKAGPVSPTILQAELRARNIERGKPGRRWPAKPAADQAD
jgi:hypothetical protein